jgi:hypothetical protein
VTSPYTVLFFVPPDLSGRGQHSRLGYMRSPVCDRNRLPQDAGQNPIEIMSAVVSFCYTGSLSFSFSEAIGGLDR